MMTPTSDSVGAGRPASGEAAWSEPVEVQHPEGSDPYAALDRDALQGAVRDREADLAGARKELYAARDERAATALDLHICREALEHREADLAGTRAELNALLDRHAHLALERDILEQAIGHREADLAAARQDAAAAIEQGRRSEKQLSALEVEVRALQDAARQASAAPPQARIEAPPLAKPAEGEPASHWDDFKFFFKLMFNLGNSSRFAGDVVRPPRGADGASAEAGRPERRPTRRRT